MPTYVYRREDGSTFELEQRISEPALTEDPETGQPVVRVITGAGLVFKGSGFYLTDYARKGEGSKEADKPAPKSAEAAAGGDSKPAATKPADTAPPAAKPAEAKPAAKASD
jgi:predicted nucleic acid-binding Zn ribbon protein